MVDIADVGKVNELHFEYQQLKRVIEAFNGGGHIISMTVAWAGGGMNLPVTVNTTSIEYPPQMVTQIIASLEAKRSELREELAGMGVTGIGDR